MNSRKIALASAFIAALSVPAAAQEQTFSVDNTVEASGLTVTGGQGTVSELGAVNFGTNTFVGESASGIDTNSFFLYDVSSIAPNLTVTEASIFFDASGTWESEQNAEFIDIYAFAPSLADGTNGAALYSATETGVRLGSFAYDTSSGTSGLMADFEIDLNADGLAALQASLVSGEFAIGASLRDASGVVFEGVQINSNKAPATTLNVTAVPEVSATGALAGFGSLLALMAFLWERRRGAAFIG